MPRFAKIEECLVQAKQNIEDLNLNDLPNFQVVHFRNDPTLVIVDRDSGLCMELCSHNVHVFDYDDDMGIVEAQHITFNKHAYINTDDYNFAVSQFELKLRDIVINPIATMIQKPLDPLEFYACDPAHNEILKIVDFYDYHKHPDTFKVLAENGVDANGYLDVQHTETIEIKDTIFQAKAIYKFKLVRVITDDKQFSISFDGDDNHNALVGKSYSLVVEKPIFSTISNAELESALQGHFSFSVVFIHDEIKNALLEVSKPRENDIICVSKTEIDFPF